MANIRFLTAGESHGKGLIGIIEGIPSGIPVTSDDIDKDLRRRQGGYGRGGRMTIESDHANILSGVRWGNTLGSPIALLIENKDWKNWEEGMSAEAAYEGSIKPVTRPRPGHADLAGAIKYDTHDIRDILERSSARETAMRVGLGAIAKKFLLEFGIIFGSYVIQIGSIKIQNSRFKIQDKKNMYHVSGVMYRELFEKAEKSPVRCPDADASKRMVRLIDKATKEGNSLGGVFEVFVTGLPVGLGSHTQWDRKLDGRLAQALMSIQAIKGVEIGMGFEMSGRSGSEVMDEIFYGSQKSEVRSQKIKKEYIQSGFYRKTNNAGGVEGGMTNGMPVIIRAAMKPIPTLRTPLMSVDINTRKPFSAAYERSDICAVPAAAVVAEAMAALVIADAFLEKFGGDGRDEVLRNYNSYMSYVNTL
ncbi:MAG: chorismate synthase [Nitrospira bacterium HGW-Nitrospira-1]|nr:MAG: chorismate synthase [Nitrospira bacterium HGW-Nitrospira-1]